MVFLSVVTAPRYTITTYPLPMITSTPAADLAAPSFHVRLLPLAILISPLRNTGKSKLCNTRYTPGK